MYDAGSASEFDVTPHAMQRVRAEARIRFKMARGQTRLADLYQSGSAKVRLPRVYDTPATAVLINTAGGLTGGDMLSFDVGASAGTHAIVTTQTAERAYRSCDGVARVSGRFALEGDAFLEWLPQETILFDASRLRRRLHADLSSGARLLMLESFVLGRKAMGETVASVLFTDSWRIRRDGRLVFADDIRLDGDPAPALSGRATADGGLAVATLIDCAPDAEDRLGHARSLVSALAGTTTRAAASAWDGVLIARFVAEDSRALRNSLMTFLTGYRGMDLPRVWHC
ncbi:MAG: urease accessory protein UreD [Roseibium sp.]